jgi:hypothetical protein
VRLYVAGPMTGLPEYNRPAFAEATARLNRVGHDAVNPGRREPVPGKSWQDYLRDGLTDLLHCEGVAVLPRWMESRGARLEVSTAWALSMPVRTVEVWAEDWTEPAPITLGQVVASRSRWPDGGLAIWCPECNAGKHDNCTERVLVDKPDAAGNDVWTECPCKRGGHVTHV